MLNTVIRELLKYSLVHRDPETQTLSIHRLVQEVLKDQMDEETQRLWAERAVRAVSRAFPFPKYSNWDRCRRYLLQAQVCSALIEQWKLLFTEAARLLNRLGNYYLRQRGEYKQVEQLHQRALTIREQVLGLEHPGTATSLVHLAGLYQAQGKYEQAEPLYEQAEPLYQRALTIYEKVSGPDHPWTATSLNTLAALYRSRGKYEQAEPLLQRSLAIREKALGPEHPDTAISLNDLALLYNSQGKYEQAEPLYQRALAICEKTLPPDHPSIANTLENYASLLKKMNRNEEATTLEERARAIRAKRST
jgi:tetratricopeptide (TPR) repeat protein